MIIALLVLILLAILYPAFVREVFVAAFFAIMLTIGSFANAMEFSGTCHGAGAVVTSFDGFDTDHATMTDVYTLPDALEYCKREIGTGAEKSIKKCIAEKLREGPLKASASRLLGVIRDDPRTREEFLSLVRGA